MSDAATSEQQEESKTHRHKPVVVKLRQTESDELRLIGCRAYPTSGLMAGASVEWCRQSRGKMSACATCPWNKA